MANVRAIRAHIKSVESTRKITKSMKMVAAAKLKRTQQSMISLQPYAAAAYEMLSRVSADPSVRDNPFLREREVKKVLYVLFVGNRGLCGVYNTALLKFAENRLARSSSAGAGGAIFSPRPRCRSRARSRNCPTRLPWRRSRRSPMISKRGIFPVRRMRSCFSSSTTPPRCGRSPARKSCSRSIRRRAARVKRASSSSRTESPACSSA